MLVLMYKVYYPDILQVIYVTLRWKIIQLNPIHHYQPSRDLAYMKILVLEKMKLEHRTKNLQRTCDDKLRLRRVNHLTHISFGHGSHPNYFLEEITGVFDIKDIVLMLVLYY